MSKKKKKDIKMDSQKEEMKQAGFEQEAEETPGRESDIELEAETADPAQEQIDYRNKYLRVMAEFENYRKRTNAEKADWIRHATKELALHVCDVLDNFERALLQAKAEDLESPFGKGITLIEKQLEKSLEKEGVKKIEALGKEFDPEFHEALAHIPSEYEENIVAAIVQNGYTMHDKVIRPVRVAVSNGKEMNTQEE